VKLRRSLLCSAVVAGTLAVAASASASTAVVRSGSVAASLRCAGGAGDCRESLRATVVETRRGGRVVAVSATKPSHPRGRTRTVVVGSHAGTVVKAGARLTTRLRLNAVGRALARRFKPMKVSLRTTSVPVPVPVPMPIPVTTPIPTPAPMPIDPACDGAPMAPPAATPGQTGVVGYFENVGGPALHCADGLRSGFYWTAGTVYVWDQSGTLVTSQAVSRGATFTLALAAGAYTVRGVPQNQSGPPPATPAQAYCFAEGPGVSPLGVVTVSAGQQSPVIVECSIP
jgi:hypothetical protein